MFPDGDAHAFAANIFKTFDHGNTGRINFRQFITTLSIQLKGNIQQKLEWAFDVYDIEKNGSISRQEVIEMIAVRAGETDGRERWEREMGERDGREETGD